MLISCGTKVRSSTCVFHFSVIVGISFSILNKTEWNPDIIQVAQFFHWKMCFPLLSQLGCEKMESKQEDDGLKLPKMQNFAEAMMTFLYCSRMTMAYYNCFLRKAIFLMCPQHGIKHKAAINNSKHWLRTLIATLCFICVVGTLRNMVLRNWFHKT